METMESDESTKVESPRLILMTIDHFEVEFVDDGGMRAADGVDCCLVDHVALVIEADGVGRCSHEEMVGSLTLTDVICEA